MRAILLLQIRNSHVLSGKQIIFRAVETVKCLLVISGSVVAQHNLHNRLPVQLSAFYLYVKDEQAAGFPVVFGCVFQKRLNDQRRHPVRKQLFRQPVYSG